MRSNRGAKVEQVDYGTSEREAALSARLIKKLEGLIAAAQIPGEIRAFARNSVPDGWLAADGSAVAISGYTALASAIYCGDAANPTAAWGYKVTSPGGSRSTSGLYIVLPDYRGEFVRGLDGGRGKDSGRTLWSSQADELKSHGHSGSTNSAGNHTHTGSTNSAGTHSHQFQRGTVTTNSNTTATGASDRVVTYTGVTDSTTSDGAHSHSLTVNPDGAHTHGVTINASGGVETRPSNLAALICIKT